MADRTGELKSRIEAKRKQVEADLEKAKADAKGSVNDAVAALEGKLKELDETVRDGWDRLSDAAIEKLNAWLR